MSSYLSGWQSFDNTSLDDLYIFHSIHKNKQQLATDQEGDRTQAQKSLKRPNNNELRNIGKKRCHRSVNYRYNNKSQYQFAAGQQRITPKKIHNMSVNQLNFNEQTKVKQNSTLNNKYYTPASISVHQSMPILVSKFSLPKYIIYQDSLHGFENSTSIYNTNINNNAYNIKNKQNFCHSIEKIKKHRSMKKKHRILQESSQNDSIKQKKIQDIEIPKKQCVIISNGQKNHIGGQKTNSRTQSDFNVLNAGKELCITQIPRQSIFQKLDLENLPSPFRCEQKNINKIDFGNVIPKFNKQTSYKVVRQPRLSIKFKNKASKADSQTKDKNNQKSGQHINSFDFRLKQNPIQMKINSLAKSSGQNFKQKQKILLKRQKQLIEIKQNIYKPSKYRQKCLTRKQLHKSISDYISVHSKKQTVRKTKFSKTINQNSHSQNKKTSDIVFVKQK